MALLVIVFNPAEAESVGSLSAALGLPFDQIQVGTDAPAADALAKAIAERASGYTHLAAVSSMQSKDVLARVAGLLDAPMATDVITVESPNTFKRPIVAGTMIETVQIDGDPIVLTFRPAGFTHNPTAPRQEIDLGAVQPLKTVRLNASERSGGRPDLAQAKVVVSGGRPLKDAETFESVIGGLADQLGGAVGATRAAVDSGIAPNELQVGQTGKIVAPDLYIAAGISGSTQHMAGIKDSKVIVAINKDPDAPIFDIADFGLVADLYDAIPELKSKL